MEKIDTVSQMVITLINAGAVMRVAYCFFRMLGNDDNRARYITVIKYTITFTVIADIAFVIRNLIFYYYV